MARAAPHRLRVRGWLRGTREAVDDAVDRAHEHVGGPTRMRVIVLLGAVLALDAADKGTVGATAAQLEHALRISNFDVGLIASVSSLAGAVGTLPAGVLTDRVNRINLLSGSIVLWSAAMLASAFAGSYETLLLTRIALGAVTATAGPTLASLTGDFFPARERARIWGLILGGELIGSAIGFVGSGWLVGMLSWRYGFGWLALPGLALAFATWRLLCEPARGGQSRLEPGAEELIPAGDVEERAADGEELEPVPEADELVQEAVRDGDIGAHDDLVLHEDPVRMPIWEAVRYVLRIRTNVVLIVASALGYFFFAGVQTFVIVLLRDRFGLGQSSASSVLIVIGLGAFAGVIAGGRIADTLLQRGRMTARVAVAAAGYMASAAIFIPALASSTLAISLPLFALAAAALAAPNAPLNAARLDIMHPRLWGRAEGVRTVLQMLAYASAPLLFGLVSDELGGPQGANPAGTAASGNGAALAYTFLIMLVPLAVGGAILLFARRTYPADVATATESIEGTTPDPAGVG
jgi:predicted MFS family arabinose efflux permease